MMKKFIYSFLTNIFIGMLLSSQSVAIAGVSLQQTRVIFKENDRNNSVIINNNSEKLYLAQSQIHHGIDSNSGVSSNFILVPPLMRIEPNSLSAIKILPQSVSVLPSDRESVFYYSVQLIPETKAHHAESGEVNTKFTVATRLVIKLFYRPKALTDNPELFAGKLDFSLENNNVLKIKNPSPYYITLTQIKLDGFPFSPKASPMVPPFSDITFSLDKSVNNVSWQIIDDFGGYSNLYTQKLMK